MKTRLSPPGRELIPSFSKLAHTFVCSKVTAHLASAKSWVSLFRQSRGGGPPKAQGMDGRGHTAEKGKEGHPSDSREEIPGAQLPGPGQRVM